MSNRLYKYYQINLGMPFQVKIPVDEAFEGHFSNCGDDGDGYNEGGSGGGDGYDGDGYDGDGYDGDGYGKRNGSGEDGYGEFIGYGERDGDGYGGDGYGGDGIYENGVYENENKRKNGFDEDPETVAIKAAEKLTNDAKRQCDDMISNARDEANNIVNEAKEQADTILESARIKSIEVGRRIEKESKEKGYNEGYEEGKAQYETLTNEARDIKRQAEEDYQKLMNGAEGDAVSLVMDVARKVIGEEIVINRQNLLIMIRDAFARCSDKDRITLKVSPDDYDYVDANRNVLLTLLEGVGNLEVKKDLSMQSGSCYVETPLGNIDAGTDTKLKKIEEAFQKVLKRTAPATPMT